MNDVVACKKQRNGKFRHSSLDFSGSLTIRAYTSPQDENQEIAESSCIASETFQISRRISALHEARIPGRFSVRAAPVQYCG